VDVFLSAGLSPHRVHHVFPSQGSGFANLASEKVVRVVCDEAGIPWQRPRHLLFERFPAIMKYYLLSPPKRDQPGGGPLIELRHFARYVTDGFRGVGV